MKKSRFFFKTVILAFLVYISLIVLFYFYNYNQEYDETSLDYGISWMVTIIYYIFCFYLLFFLIDLNTYNKFFLITILIGTLLWIFTYILEFLKYKSNFLNLSTVQDMAVIICFSILSPGLTLNFIKYIKNNSNQDKKRKLIRNYHIHEGFVGLLFVIIAIFFWLLRLIMIQYKILKYQLRIYLALDMVLLFLFLFSGNFLIFRDRRDVLKLKFIEKRGHINSNNSSSVFNPITVESIEFFQSPRILLYPFGILLSSFAVSIFIHGTDFLPEIIFNTDNEILVLIGIVLSIIAGGMIGMDWYRIFARLYPHLYQELEQVLKTFVK
ncbi:MAG: hypothetical protein ACFFDH_02290 [Promethearchaeota archaeon]